MNNALPAVINGLEQYIVEQDALHIVLSIPDGVV